MIRIPKEDFLEMFKTIDKKTGRTLLSNGVKQDFSIANIQKSNSKNRYVCYDVYYRYLVIKKRFKDLERLKENN